MRAEDVLPLQDQRYLQSRGLSPSVVTEGDRKGLMFRDWQLPEGKFDHASTNILVELPPGYPDAAPDMFHCNPWLRISEAFPLAADQEYMFAGCRWQRWSRHNPDWRPGVDGIHTTLLRISAALNDATA